MPKAKIFESQISLKSLRARNLNRIAKIGYGHLCLREELRSPMSEGGAKVTYV
jgi:hypothetical protein